MITQTSTLSRADRAFLDKFLPDEELAPWMAITDLHRLAVTAAVQPLTWFGEASRPDWYVASELALYYTLTDGGSNFIVPDVFVARVPNHPRTSYQIAAEGSPPFFVLEVASTESRERDTGTGEGKVRLYGLLGVAEYAIFDPERTLVPPLQGYRRGPGEAWAPWPAGARGELVSAALGLTLVADRTLLRFEDTMGRRLPTADELRIMADQERIEAARARARADQEQIRAEREQARAEEEQARADQEQARAEQEQARARAERARAVQEQARAEQAQARADQERARADAGEAELARMRALLARHGLASEP